MGVNCSCFDQKDVAPEMSLGRNTLRIEDQMELNNQELEFRELSSFLDPRSQNVSAFLDKSYESIERKSIEKKSILEVNKIKLKQFQNLIDLQSVTYSYYYLE